LPSRTRKRCAWPRVFRQSALARRVERATRVEREFDFLMAVEDLVIHGQVDLWFEEGGELVIVDYKTDSVTAREAHQRAQDTRCNYGSMRCRGALRRPCAGPRLAALSAAEHVCGSGLVAVAVERPEQIVRDFKKRNRSWNSR